MTHPEATEDKPADAVPDPTSCPECGGSGALASGAECPTCEGTGRATGRTGGG